MKLVRNKLFLVVAGLYLLSLASSCRHTSPTGPSDILNSGDTSSCCHARITLTMTDSVTGHLLDGGSASLYGNDQLISTKSMSTSGTVWDGLCPGHYHVTVSKDGYHTETFLLDTLGCNGTETPQHVLDPEARTNGDSCCHGILEISVHDSNNGESITGATVNLTNRTNGSTYTRMTSSGLVRFDGVCPGNYLCIISNTHFDSSKFDFEMTCNDSLSFSKSIAMVAANAECDTTSTTIHVRDSLHRDSNIAGATVTIRIDGHHDNFASGITNAEGYYYSDSNLPGHETYIVTISKDGYHTRSIIMQVGDCRNYSELVYLSPQ